MIISAKADILSSLFSLVVFTIYVDCCTGLLVFFWYTFSFWKILIVVYMYNLWWTPSFIWLACLIFNKTTKQQNSLYYRNKWIVYNTHNSMLSGTVIPLFCLYLFCMYGIVTFSTLKLRGQKYSCWGNSSLCPMRKIEYGWLILYHI